jgi:hypothetical protein
MNALAKSITHIVPNFECDPKAIPTTLKLEL